MSHLYGTNLNKEDCLREAREVRSDPSSSQHYWPFKPDANPVFHKAIPVPIAVQEDLESALQAGIKRGIWEPTQFNAYGTPAVPFRKKTSQGQSCLRVYGDYSVTINPQLETRRHQMHSHTPL
ncbi:hypothetical protein RRG08_002540 [Elysia crispata]|uniref:Uncharacterized protein n=1 Tax=Elysia crispata TaxID=231223 RepID=A0AAE0Y4J7_9GAST|nr:hypothetical protein RRG08_002540 [Elysia crispata]